MTTERDLDRLVVRDDAIAARLWPRLGPKVRHAYLHDRDAWVVLRRQISAGGSLPAATLIAQQRVFAGWARAFRAAAAGKTKRSRPGTIARRAAAPASVAAPLATRANVTPPAPASPRLIAPGIVNATNVRGGTGTAVAGGLVLAGLIAVAARRKRA